MRAGSPIFAILTKHRKLINFSNDDEFFIKNSKMKYIEG